MEVGGIPALGNCVACALSYGEDIRGRRCANADFDTGICAVDAFDAAQHQRIARTDRGMSPDRSGICQTVGGGVAEGTDAGEERAGFVGNKCAIADSGVVAACGVEATVTVGKALADCGPGQLSYD